MVITVAFEILYNSDTYQKLLNPTSDLYFQSPRHVLFYLDKEFTQGNWKVLNDRTVNLINIVNTQIRAQY